MKICTNSASLIVILIRPEAGRSNLEQATLRAELVRVCAGMILGKRRKTSSARG